jgi:hypothetical protein
MTMSMDTHRLLERMVEWGVGPNASAIVEQAIREQARAFRRQQLVRAYEEAASDPAFLREMDAITSEFDVTLTDGLKP